MASKTAFISERYFWMCFINLHQITLADPWHRTLTISYESKTIPCSSHFKRVKAYCQMHCDDSTGKQ